MAAGEHSRSYCCRLRASPFSKPATPGDPTAVVLEALRTHPIVALSEGPHWNLQSHAVRMSLVRDARLAAAANDIVVEFGGARYQAVMDRYIAGGTGEYEIKALKAFCARGDRGSGDMAGSFLAR